MTRQLRDFENAEQRGCPQGRAERRAASRVRGPVADFWQDVGVLLPLIAIAISVAVWYRTNDAIAK